MQLTTDEIVLSVMDKFNTRSQVGVNKYGTTLQDNNTDNFLKHLQEELMDAVNYIEKLQAQGLGKAAISDKAIRVRAMQAFRKEILMAYCDSHGILYDSQHVNLEMLSEENKNKFNTFNEILTKALFNLI